MLQTLKVFRLQGNFYGNMSSVCKHNLNSVMDVRRKVHLSAQRLAQKVLGIETSCDDTGCAIVDGEGNILGNALESQIAFHNANGGVLPPFAASLHKKNIVNVVNEALAQAHMRIEDVDAIATTVKPGLGPPLEIGLAYGSHLSKRYKKPFIPIHHMKAHALAVRITRKDVDFPFLTLLISGGHTLLGIARSVDRFELMGDFNGIALGDIMDKVARRLKLLNLPEYRNMSGGRAIELAATKASDVAQYSFPATLMRERNCNFNLSGISSHCLRLIEKTESEHGVEPDGLIPGYENLCAGLQLHLAHYVCLRVQYAMTLVQELKLIENSRPFLVVSGGAACNQFFRSALEKVCDVSGFRFAAPPPELCTDNGIMIAWNGVERLKTDWNIVDYGQVDTVTIEPRCPLGTDISQTINEYKYSCEWITKEDLLRDSSSESSSLVFQSETF